MNFFKIIVLMILWLSFSYADTKPLKILIFQSYSHTLPWSKQITQGIDEFSQESSRKIEFYIETVDHIRLKKQMKPQEWEQYLSKKYRGIKFDGILVETLFAGNVLSKIANNIYENIPIIYLGDVKIRKQKHILISADSKEYIPTKTIKLIKHQNKNLQNIYIIKAHHAGKEIEQKMLKELSKESFNTVLLENFTIEGLQNILATLPKNSVVFYILNFTDKSGKEFVPKEFLKKIVQASNSPIYSFWSTFLSTGTIGGYMIDGVTSAKSGLNNLIFYIENGYFDTKIEDNKLFFDYKAIKKFNLDYKAYKDEATIINRFIPVWENYPKETFFAFSTIAFLSLLLILTYFLKVRNDKILKMEKSMLLQSKQAAMGEMISVIAHQWRQPLNNISVIVQTILLKYKKNKIDDTIMDKFKVDILKQIHHMSNTIDDFKDFYKPNKQKSTFNIKKELLKTIELIDNSYKKENIVIDKYSLENFMILGYPHELSHCFLIILQNAKDALCESDIKDKRIQVSTRVDKKEYLIIFENNGNKISEDIIDKIFEPYFSTKSEKNGTGIGLYMLKLIIEKHFNGTIIVTNNQEGVKFEIRLRDDR